MVDYVVFCNYCLIYVLWFFESFFFIFDLFVRCFKIVVFKNLEICYYVSKLVMVKMFGLFKILWYSCYVFYFVILGFSLIYLLIYFGI